MLTSVGVDIGSSTSHLLFSRIVMKRSDNLYVVKSREILFESAVMLTPYKDDTAIDANALRPFIAEQYRLAGIGRDEVDAGALILTGLAVRRRNARAIGELFADEAGRFVAVSAGDALEAALVAWGSGAVTLSANGPTVMNVDIGGGTSKIAVCINGAIADRTVVDVGARIIRFDKRRRVLAAEDTGLRIAEEAGVDVTHGRKLGDEDCERLAKVMTDKLFAAMGMGEPLERAVAMLRLPSLQLRARPSVLSFSGGVSEYIEGRVSEDYGDLGPWLASAVHERATDWCVELRTAVQGIRATAIGASQYTVQVSGSTIFVTPDCLPLRNVAAISPPLPVDGEDIDADAVARAVRGALDAGNWQQTGQPVALFFRWAGSATYRRLDDFCRGVLRGLAPLLDTGLPLVLVTDSDIGGLVGQHCAEASGAGTSVVSVDGIVARDFDFIDIGAFIEESGAVPVVVKSLVFPASAA